MKKTLALLLAIMLLIAAIPATSFAAAANGKINVYRVKTNGGTLYLHSKPNSKASTRIGSLKNGTPFQVLDTSGKYYRIKTLSEPVRTGWIYKSYTARNANAKVTTQVDPVVIRSGPGTGYKKLGVAPKGAQVTVKAINGNWYNVTYRGITGWSSKYYSGRTIISWLF